MKSQITLEYILIMTVALLLLLPAIYFFRNYTFESNDRIIQLRLNDISDQIVSKAKKTYFYGPPSKTSFSIEMPAQINRMFIMNYGSEYFLGFKISSSQGNKEFVFKSDIPMVVGDKENICEDIDYCKDTSCECFKPRDYSEGLKTFLVQAEETCNCVKIYHVS